MRFDRMTYRTTKSDNAKNSSDILIQVKNDAEVFDHILIVRF